MNNADNRAKRLHQANMRLGGIGSRCGICGFDNPLCLEAHHIAGQKFAPETVAICRNCHRILSDWQKDHPLLLEEPRSLEESIIHFLEGAADLFELLVQMLRRLASELREKISSKEVLS